MKLNKTLTALAVGASFGLSGQAFAEGTTAGTPITNTATLSYEVNSTAIAPTANSATFNVDTKINLTFEWKDTGGLISTEAGTQTVFKYELANTGNAAQHFQFSAQDLSATTAIAATGEDDDIDSNGSFAFFIDGGDGSFGGDDIAVAAANVTQDAIDVYSTTGDEITVWVVTTAIDTAENGDQFGLAVKAGATQSDGSVIVQNTTESKSANLTAIYNVFAEALSDSGLLGASGTRDGAYVAVSGAEVDAAEITNTKTVSVKSDPINGTTNPRAIPGAIVTYTLTIENTGGAAATNLTILDDINALAGIKDGSITNTVVTTTATHTDNSDTTKIDITIPSLAASDGTPSSGPDYIQIVFDAEVE